MNGSARSVDILILSNGPGELTTWVKPVVQALRQRLGNDRDQVRISIVLSPCPNASGQEAEIAQHFPEVDRVQAATHFFNFLLWGKTVANWDWRRQGVVLFLGGDQFFPVVIAKRLGYRTVVYAEWEARWHAWIDRFGVMQPAIATHASPKYASKFTVVGDLMAEAGGSDAGENATNLTPPHPIVACLPGSKAMKLSLGLPLLLAVAERVHQVRSDVEFVAPVAPTLTLTNLAKFADPASNLVIERLGWAAAELVQPPPGEGLPYLKTAAGLRMYLWTQFPAYEQLAQCSLALTTVGANTAELGALAVPMIVLLPTQQLDVMRAWDGLPGLLANLPGVGATFAKGINWFVLRQGKLLAWPNIWAGREVVPELVGNLQPQAVADLVLDWLAHPEMLTRIRQNLRQVRGQPGAAAKLVQLVCEELDL